MVRTPICDLLGIEHPIALGGMGSATSPALVAAVSRAGGMGVLARLVGPILLPLMLGAGMFLQIVYPGDFDYVLRDPAPAWITYFSVVGAVVGESKFDDDILAIDVSLIP